LQQRRSFSSAWGGYAAAFLVLRGCAALRRAGHPRSRARHGTMILHFTGTGSSPAIARKLDAQGIAVPRVLPTDMLKDGFQLN